MSVFDRWSSTGGPAQASGSVFDRWSSTGGPEEDEGGGVLDTVLDVVTTPGRMTAGAISALQEGVNPFARMLENRPTALGGTREDDFDDVLANAGMEDTFGRRAVGLALDVVADPLNVVPVAPVVKGLAKVARPLTKAVRESSVGRELTERFVPYAGLDKFKTTVGAQELSYQDLRRLHESTRQDAREKAGQKVLELFKGITNDEAFEIAKALDEGLPLMDPRLDSIRAQAAKLYDEQFKRETAAHVMSPGARRVNYTTHLFTKDARRDPLHVRSLTGKNPFQVRKELSLEQGVQAGIFEPDIRRAMSVRLATGDRAILDQDFMLKTAKQFGVKAQKGKVPPGFVRPQLDAEPRLKKALKGVYLPEEIARDLEKMIELPQQAGPISEMASAATALWKGYATRANPGFHTRNAVSNMLQTWFGGLGDTGTKVLDPFVVVAKHAQAARMLHDRNLIPNIGQYTGDDIRKALDQYGVIGGQHTSFNELDDIIEGEIKHAGQGIVRRNLNPLDKRNVILRGGAQVGNVVENTSRLALFLDQLEKGRTLEQAALHVRKYLFDYSELTPFERKVRDRALPFYTWLRKNIPLQVDNVLNQPDKMAVLGKGFDAVEDTTTDRGLALEPTQVPEWMQEEYLQIPFRTDEGDAVFVNPNLPIQDLNMLTPNAERDVLSALSPLVRIPLELAINRQFFTGYPLWDKRLGPMGDFKRAPDLLQAVGAVSPGTLPESDRGVEIPAAIDYALRQAPPLTQFGKLATAVTSEQDENISGVDLDMLTFAGLPARVVSEKAAREQEKMRRNYERGKKRAEQKEQRRLTKPQVKSIYERYKER